jgi:hypothetical protein
LTKKKIFDILPIFLPTPPHFLKCTKIVFTHTDNRIQIPFFFFRFIIRRIWLFLDFFMIPGRLFCFVHFSNLPAIFLLGHAKELHFLLFVDGILSFWGFFNMSFYVCRLGFPWQEFFRLHCQKISLPCLRLFIINPAKNKSYTTSVIFYYFGGGIWYPEVGHLFKLNWFK